MDTLNRAHYLPQHAVKKESATTPARIVFDCRCQSSSNSPSFSNCLVVVPPFLSNVWSIIIRYRSFTYGLSTDIEEVFLHVGLDGSDRDLYQIFLVVRPWESKKQIPSLLFQLKTVLFGWTNFPFMLNGEMGHTGQYVLVSINQSNFI